MNLKFVKAEVAHKQRLHDYISDEEHVRRKDGSCQIQQVFDLCAREDISSSVDVVRLFLKNYQRDVPEVQACVQVHAERMVVQDFACMLLLLSR